MKKLLSAILVCSLMAALFVLPSDASSTVGKITGETSRTVEQIKLPNGSNSGVDFTTVNFTGHYGSNKVLEVAEADLSDTHLSVDVFNCGTYIVSKQKVAAAAQALSVNGKTVLAAVNGDLWMTSSYGNGTSVLAVSRGPLMIDREIWATQEIVQEAGIGGLKDAFAITSKNQPLVGSPDFKITVNNTTRNITVAADGLNRLPGNNAIVLYNRRVNSSNYALSDAYEIELESSSPVFTIAGTVTAKVKAIYQSGSSTRPGIGANTIIITARGTRMGEVEGFRVGDTVCFTASVTDSHNNTDMWQDAVDLIGGHMMPRFEGDDWGSNTDTSEYPTTFIGIGNTGKVMLSTVCASSNGAYKGLRFYLAREFCREMGYNSVFYLDGGGSATMVTLKNGTYTVRNCTSDGSPRSVINGVAITWNQTPVCDRQGPLDYMINKVYLTNKSPAFIDGALLPCVLSGKNEVFVRNIKGTADAAVTSSKTALDAYFCIDYSCFTPVTASDYKYVVIKARADKRLSGTIDMGLFYSTGSDGGFSSERYLTQNFVMDGEWQYLMYRMSTQSSWSGTLNGLRFDLYERSGVPLGYTTEVGFVALCRNLDDVKNVKDDIPPEGSLGYYLCYTGEHLKDTVPGIAPTCTEAGHTAASACSLCGTVFSQSVEIPAFGHAYVDGICTRCGAEDPEYVTEIPGDADGDGKVTAKDVNIVKKMISGIVPSEGNKAADVNCDNKITVADVNMLKRIVSGK